MTNRWGGSWSPGYDTWGGSWDLEETAVTGNSILDLNTRLSVFLNAFYGTSADPDELTTILDRYLEEEKTGDYTDRLNETIDDATA